MSISLRKKTAGILGAAVVATGLFGTTPSADAAVVTYDLRLGGSLSGKSAGVTAGQVVTVDLYAILSDGAGNGLTDDGMFFSFGSFQSAGAFTGGADPTSTLRGNISAKSFINNSPPFNTGLAQAGYRSDIDGDGDLDVGSLEETGSPSPTPWWAGYAPGITASGDRHWFPGAQDTEGAFEEGEPIPDGQADVVAFSPFGSPTGTGGHMPSEGTFLIGRTTLTVSSAATGGSVVVNFVPRIRTDGNEDAQKLHKFRVDGVDYALNGNGDDPATPGIENHLAVNPGVTLAIPEPTSMSLLGLAGLALLGRRRK